MNDDKVILTPEQAEALLAQGEQVHNFVSPGMGMLVGCDYERASALEKLRNAEMIELGGPSSMALKHPIVVHEVGGRTIFFEADMDRVREFEAKLAA